MKLRQWQNIFHMIVKGNSIVQYLIQIKNRIIIHASVNVCLIILFSHMAQLLLPISLYVSVQVRIFPLNKCNIIIYRAQWWEKYLSKRSLIKHICSWREKRIVLWRLNRQANIFSLISRRIMAKPFYLKYGN